jgi:hypothetical protein
MNGIKNKFDIRQIRGHVEVFLNGTFLFSADNRGEAKREIEFLTERKIL